MIKKRTLVSTQSQGSFHKTIHVEHHDAYGPGFVRFTVDCPGRTIGSAQFNLSVSGAEALRDVLSSLFPVKNEVTDKPVTAYASPHGAQEYKGNGKHDWEEVGDSNVRRLRVPGGWLYRIGFTASSVFVPLPDVVGYKI